MITLVASCGAQAALESVPLVKAWCVYLFAYGNMVKQAGGQACGHPTALAAANAVAVAWNIYFRPRILTIISCHDYGEGFCSYTITEANGYVSPVRDEIEGFTNKGDHCPVPTTFQAVQYHINYATNMCERTVPDSLLITLSGGTEVEPSNGSDKKFLPIIATVKDQNDQPPTTPVTLRISLKVDPKSGGHDHGDSTRPRGGVAEVETCPSDDVCWTSPQPTDGNGQVVFNFNAPEASGTHTISATCEGCSNTATKPVDVKVVGLRPIPPSGLYALYETDGSVIGAVKNRHESNHYLTPTAANMLLVIAINYHHQYPNDPVLHVNDGSLMWGGVLDFDAEAEWNAPHKEHRRGTVVDIRANSKTGAIPSGNFESFKRLAKLRKVHAKLHSEGQTNQHFHVRLLNRSE